MHIITSNRRVRIRAVGLGVLLTAICALAGCGDSGEAKSGVASGGGKAAAPTSSAPAINDTAAWTKCLRNNGIDVKDPEPGTGVGLPPDSPALTAAMNKCKQFQPVQSGTTGADVNDPKAQERARKWRKCMRDQGVDMPDPVPGKGVEMTDGDNPAFTAAFEKCSKEFPVGGGK